MTTPAEGQNMVQAGSSPDGAPDRSEFLTTLHFPRRVEWRRRGRCLTADDPSPLVRFVRIVTGARRGRPVALNGFARADLLAGICLARLRRTVPVVMVDATWQRGTSRWDRLVTRAGVRLLAGPRTTFCVSSHEEAARWPDVWGVPAEHLAVLHWHHGVEAPEAEVEPGDGTVFSGGRALRDYETLLAAAEQVEAQVTIAADAAALPAATQGHSRVTVGRLPLSEFHHRLATASAVVVPLEPGHSRSAGQTTYLDAMALGGLVLVSDTIGVREHVEHLRTGLLWRAGDAADLAATLRWALDPANADEVRAIRLAGRRMARDHFGPDAFVSTALDIIVRSESTALVPKTRS